jgi:hypothetical protein
MRTMQAGRLRFDESVRAVSHPEPVNTNEVLASLWAGAAAPAAPALVPAPAQPASSATVTAVQAATLEKILIQYIGPMGEIVCADHLAQAGNLKALIAVLADEVPDKAQAALFTREANRMVGVDLEAASHAPGAAGPARRQRSEQNFTFSQSRSHFLRHVNGKPQCAQILLGKSDFLRIFIVNSQGADSGLNAAPPPPLPTDQLAGLMRNQFKFQPPLLTLMPNLWAPAVSRTVCRAVAQVCQPPVAGMLMAP